MQTSGRRPSRSLAFLALAAISLALLSACAPQTAELRGPEGPVASELQRTAQLAYHRMEIAYLETGDYTTNALVDLDLPRGVKWTLEEFSTTGYRLRFTDDNRPGEAWLVSPDGVALARGA